MTDREERSLFRRHVPRPRLTRLLAESRAQAIVLTAPPGYGKTVLAAEWTLGREAATWYRATAASADLAVFARGIAESLARVCAESALPSAGGLAFGSDDAPRQAAELLAPSLASWPADGLLVVDDYHLVQPSRAAEEFLDWLLMLTPVRVLVTTRTRPSWASARRLLYGDVLELGRSQLAMSDDEAAAVLAGESPGEVRRALARAQGWPALVGLAALAATTDAPQESVSETLYRYFAEEVLRSRPPPTQRFMLESSVPNTIDLDVAEALGLEGAAEALEELAGEGLLQPVGAGFRYHPLLRDFLRRRLRGEQPARQQELLFRSIDTAVGAGRVDEAFELAAESGQLDRAAAIVAEHATDLLADSRDETLARWLDACGSLVATDPELLLAQAALQLRRGDPASALAVAHDVAERLDPSDPNSSRAWYLAASALNLMSERERALVDAERARERAVSRYDRMNALLLCALTAAAIEIDEAAYLEELEELAVDDLPARFRLASARIWCSFARPTLAGTWERVASVVPLADHCDGAMLRSDVLGAAAYLSVLRGDYELARGLAESAVSVAAEFKLRVPHVYCLLYLANAEIGRREFGLAETALAGAEQGALEQHGVRVTAASTRLKLALARGDEIDPVPLAELGVERAGKSSRGQYAALCALAAARAGDGERLRREIETARRTTRGVEARFHARYAELGARLRDCDDVQEELCELVKETAEADALDCLVAAYRVFPELLHAAAADPDAAAVARRAVKAGHDHALARAAGFAPPDAAAPLHDALTPRESEVLALMAEGLSNVEIGSRLFISSRTVKVHVHHILEKLGSRSRIEAVLKSRLTAEAVTSEVNGKEGR